MAKAQVNVETVIVDPEPGCGALCFFCVNIGEGGPSNTIIKVSHDADVRLTVRTKKDESFIIKPGATHRVELGKGRGPAAANAVTNGYSFSFEDGRGYSVSRDTKHVRENQAAGI